MQSKAQTSISSQGIDAGALVSAAASSALLAVRERLSDMTNALGQRDVVALEQHVGSLREALLNLRPALEKSPALTASADVRLQLNLMRAEVSAQRQTLARASAAVARHLAVVIPTQPSPLYSERGNTALAGYTASEKA